MFPLAVVLMAAALSTPAAAVTLKEQHLKGIQWRFVGPQRGGRVNAVVGHPEKRLTFYAGYTGGGIWKTDDGGHTWVNLSDGQLRVGSVGALAISRSNPDILYAGTGEQALRGDVSHGDGVYRSRDGGETWISVGLTETRQISHIVVHPQDPDIVYVAAIGHFAGPNPQRGVFKSIDGGASWQRVLFVDENTGAVSLALDPSNPRNLYAAMWDVRRFPWGIRNAGKGGGFYRSRDGGKTWQNISNNPGLPGGLYERCAIDVSASDPQRIWALVSSSNGKGLYRSDDYGDTWVATSREPDLVGRNFYFMKMLADPRDRDRVYVLNYQVHRSNDGGETFTALSGGGHADHHAFWVDPEDNRRLIDGTDGGAQISFNGGATWSTLYNQPTGQFYTVSTDQQVPYRVYGSQQDWSSVAVPSRERKSRIPGGGVYDTGWSEAGHIAVRPDNPDILYISDHHWLLRYDRRADTVQYIGPRDETNYGWGTRDIKLRFNWTFPVLLSPHNPDYLYVGSQYLHRSTDEGRTWTTISPDLTRADPDKLEPTPLPGRDTSANARYWGPVTRDSNGDHWFSTLYTIAESPRRRGVIWTGSDDGVVQVSRNHGKRWQNVTPPGLPDYALITRVEPSPFDPAAAYVSASAYKLDDYRVLLYKTGDYGKTWTEITAGLGDHDIVRVVRADPRRKGLLYAGSETGVFISFDDGHRWQPLQLNLPAVPVYDMQVKGSDLVIATHGRGFWILDDLSVLRQIGVEPQGLQQPFYLFSPRDTLRWAGAWRKGVNPPPGVALHYHLERPAESDMVMVISDAGGNPIRQFRFRDGELSNHRGLNTFVWDLRYPNAVCAPGVVTRGNTQVGPVALPGEYTATLTVDGRSQQVAFKVLVDPRIDAGPRELRRQFEFLLQVRDKISAVNETVIALRSLRARLTDSLAALDESGAADLVSLGRVIHSRLDAIEEELVQPRAKYRKDLHANPVKVNDKLYRLANFVGRAQAEPTRVKYQLYEEFSTWADTAIAAFVALQEVEVTRYNKWARQRGLPAVVAESGGGGSCNGNRPSPAPVVKMPAKS